MQLFINIKIIKLYISQFYLTTNLYQLTLMVYKIVRDYSRVSSKVIFIS